MASTTQALFVPIHTTIFALKQDISPSFSCKQRNCLPELFIENITLLCVCAFLSNVIIAFKKSNTDKYQLVEVDDDDDDGGGACEGAALGKLSIAQIEKGQAVLTQIRAALTSNSSSAKGKGKQKAAAASSSSSSLADLSGQFYSLIPTTSGRVKPPPLNNLDLVEENEGLLEFWLRMGFESVETEPTPLGASPIDGVKDLPLPKTLRAAASSVSDASSIQQSQVGPVQYGVVL